MDTTTITVDMKVKRKLDALKRAKRETYNEVLRRILARTPQEVDAESLEETLEIMSDPNLMRQIADSIEDIRKGRLVDIDDI